MDLLTTVGNLQKKLRGRRAPMDGRRLLTDMSVGKCQKKVRGRRLLMDA